MATHHGWPHSERGCTRARMRPAPLVQEGLSATGRSCPQLRNAVSPTTPSVQKNRNTQTTDNAAQRRLTTHQLLGGERDVLLEAAVAVARRPGPPRHALARRKALHAGADLGHHAQAWFGWCAGGCGVARCLQCPLRLLSNDVLRRAGTAAGGSSRSPSKPGTAGRSLRGSSSGGARAGTVEKECASALRLAR